MYIRLTRWNVTLRAVHVCRRIAKSDAEESFEVRGESLESLDKKREDQSMCFEEIPWAHLAFVYWRNRLGNALRVNFK